MYDDATRLTLLMALPIWVANDFMADPIARTGMNRCFPALRRANTAIWAARLAITFRGYTAFRTRALNFEDMILALLSMTITGRVRLVLTAAPPPAAMRAERRFTE
jgi:hypothetical protein